MKTLLCLDVLQHLWDGDGGEADVSKGQVGEEEVHGGVEVGVRVDSQDDKEVSKHSDQVHAEEKANMRGCSSCSSENPRRRNFETPVMSLVPCGRNDHK